MTENTELEYNKGFYDGLMEAAATLRSVARDYRLESEASKKVLESQANELAAVLLLAWANGIEINADSVLRK